MPAPFTYSRVNYTSPSSGATLISGAWSQMDAALTAQGWTALDTLTAGSDVVYRSADYDTGVPGYYAILRATKVSAGIQFQFYMDWDTSSHTGMNSSIPSSLLTYSKWSIPDSSGLSSYPPYGSVVQIRANRFAIAGVCAGYYTSSGLQPYNPAGFYAGWVQRFDSPAQAGFASVSGSLSSGATTISGLNRDLTGTIQVGQKLIIFNFYHSSSSANASNCEQVTIATVGSSSVTISGGLTNNYDAGAILMPYSAQPTYGYSYSTPWAYMTPSGYFTSGGPPITSTGLPFSAAPSNTFLPSAIQGRGDGGITGASYYSASGLGIRGSFQFSMGDALIGTVGRCYHYLCVGAVSDANGSAMSTPLNNNLTFTDGINCYDFSAIGITVGSYAPHGGACLGPTGASPNFSTQIVINAPPSAPSDTQALVAVAVASPTSVPTCGFDQGFN